MKVVASFSILADLVRQVGATGSRPTALAGPNADMHAFQPTPADAKTLAGANLVVINGLGFEGWADRLVKSSGYKGPADVASKASNRSRPTTTSTAMAARDRRTADPTRTRGRPL